MKERPVSLVSLVVHTLPREFVPYPDPNEKPLPRLPHGWACRLCHETGLLLRSIGLGVIVSTLSGVFRTDFVEPPKVAIRRNRVTALLRALMHVTPAGVALFEILLNWHGCFYDAEFTQQASYRIAAKVHELTIQSSLALIVLSYIRHEAVLGNGIPFGAFIGGLEFLQITYLWSPELWAVAAAKGIQVLKKLRMLAILITCGILATTVGLSSATLLIPRQIYWSLGSSHFWVNGSYQDIWPDRLDSIAIPEDCAVLGLWSQRKSLCPAGAFAYLHEVFSEDNPAFNRNDWISFSENPFVMNHASPILKNNVADICRDTSKNQVCQNTLHDVVLEGAHKSVLEWRETAAMGESFRGLVHKISSGYRQPYSIASCVSDVITDVNKDEQLAFPSISEMGYEPPQNRLMVSLPNVTKAQITQTPGNESEFRLEWLELPQTLFRDQVIGAAIVHPVHSNSDTSVNVTLCTLGAGWDSSATNYDTGKTSQFYSRIKGGPKVWPVTDEKLNTYTVQSSPKYDDNFGFMFPQRRIAITKDWARFLNPTIPISESSNSTALHLLLTANSAPTDFGAKTPRVLASMLGSGLASVGRGLGSQAGYHGSTPCEGCLEFQVDHAIYGLGYSAHGVSTKLALAVMLTYCIIAVAHTVYLLTTGISSTAWESTAEIVALAMNSSATRHLRNTCAGIVGVKTFQMPVRVLARSVDDGDDHLEMVFGEVEQSGACMKTIEMNRKYGNVRLN